MFCVAGLILSGTNRTKDTIPSYADQPIDATTGTTSTGGVPSGVKERSVKVQLYLSLNIHRWLHANTNELYPSVSSLSRKIIILAYMVDFPASAIDYEDDESDGEEDCDPYGKV